MSDFTVNKEPDGAWVSFEDYQSLRSELVEARAREAQLREAIQRAPCSQHSIPCIWPCGNAPSDYGPCWKQAALSTPGPSQHSDDLAVDKLAAAMKAKLAKKRQEGRGGWESHETCPPGRLQRMLLDHLPKGDPVDIANFAMMLFNRGESTTGPSLADIQARALEQFVVDHQPSTADDDFEPGWIEAIEAAQKEAARLRQSEGGEG